MDYKYSFQRFDEMKMARAVGKSLPISVKHSVELANSIRGKNVQKAKKYLQDVIDIKQPVAYGRFNQDLAHKKGMGPGRYPKKTAIYFLSILKLAEANAADKNLSTEDLVIVHIAANKAAGRWHYGRQRRRQFKSAHLEVVVEEKPAEKKAKPKPEMKKPEAKKETVNAEKKPAAKRESVKVPVKSPDAKEAKPVEKKADVKPVEKKLEAAKPAVEKEETKPVEKAPAEKKAEIKTEEKKPEVKPAEKKEAPIKAEKPAEKKEEIKPAEQKSQSQSEKPGKEEAKND